MIMKHLLLYAVLASSATCYLGVFAWVNWRIAAIKAGELFVA